MENTNKKNNEQKKTKTKNEALVEIRKKEGITQEQMAEKLHVSARMYRHYEDNELPLPSVASQSFL